MADTPKIRFEGFTDAWEERKLGEVAGRVYGGGTPKTGVEEYWDGNIPWIQSSNLSEHELFSVDIQKYITKLGLQKSAAQLVPKNSIAVVSHVGVGKIVFMPFDYTTSQDFISLSELSSNLIFTCYVLYKRLQEDLHIVQGSVIKGITKDDLLSKEVMFPSLAEQEKIGSVLQNLDHLITLHQCKCDETKALKKYMLQKMFPQNGKKVPEIRFVGFTDEWGQRKLGDWTQLITKGTTPSRFDEHGKVTYVKIEALNGKKVVKELCSSISEEIHRGELARSILKENDIVFAIAGALGKCAVITKDLLPANTNQALAIIRLKDNISREFIYFSLVSKQMEIYINQIKSVGAQPNLSLEQMNKFVFYCPNNIEEQSKIGSYFSNLDNLITLHQRKCDELKEVKKFMLQNMFPQKG